MSEDVPDEPEPLEYESPKAGEAPLDDPSAGARLFVIFFLAIVPLLGFAIVAMVLYSLLVR